MENLKEILMELEKSGRREAGFWLLGLREHVYFRLKDVNELLKSRKKAIKFFVMNGFWRGRRDEQSALYANCFLKAFEEVFDDMDLDDKNILKEYIGDLLKAYSKEVEGIGYRINPKDVEMIESVFRCFIMNHSNPVKYIVEEIKEGRIKEVLEELCRIRNWGNKLSSMLLRNIVLYFKLEKYLKEEDYVLFFPMDTHVKQMINLLWPESTKISDLNKLARFSVKKVREMKLSPLYVNIGLWLIHAKAPRIIEFLLQHRSKLWR